LVNETNEEKKEVIEGSDGKTYVCEKILIEDKLLQVLNLQTGILYAMKLSKDKKKGELEYELLKKLQHCDSICSVHDGFRSKTLKSHCIIMTHYSHNLFKYIQQMQKNSTEAELREHQRRIMKWIKQAVNGLFEIHAVGITHRDLKPDNILLDDKMNLKIADFDCATEQETPSTCIGTTGYVAPEIFQGYTTKADMWSLGCVLLDLLTLTFSNSKELLKLDPSEKVLSRIQSIRTGYSTRWRTIVEGLLQLNPNARMTCEQIEKILEQIKDEIGS